MQEVVCLKIARDEQNVMVCALPSSAKIKAGHGSDIIASLRS